MSACAPAGTLLGQAAVAVDLMVGERIESVGAKLLFFA